MRTGLDYIGIGVGAIIFNKKGQVFLAKRGRGARNERHKWEFPGGSVEFGETLKKALVREIQEEFDFSITVVQLLDVIDHILPGEKQHWVSPVYLCRHKSGVPRILEPAKCEQIGWFAISEIPHQDLTNASRDSLKCLKRFLTVP